MDSYDVTGLPGEPLFVCVASTAGQGDPPDNMRRFWRFLLRKSLPPTSLSACRYGVFGLGDSGYINYNVVAKKLDRRLQGLGATPLLERGLGDDQHPNGYEAALDPWLVRLWAALRAACPLPEGIPEPVLSEEALLALGPPRYRVAFLAPDEALRAAEVLAARLQREQPHVAGLADAVRQAAALPSAVRQLDGAPQDGTGMELGEGQQAQQPQELHAARGSGTGCLEDGSGGGVGKGIVVQAGDAVSRKGCDGGGQEATRRTAEAAAAATDFRRLALHVSGVEADPAMAEPVQNAVQQSETATAAPSCTSGRSEPSSEPYTYGPWRPYLARLVVNRRVTTHGHFQDTRHVELDLGASGLSYEPGDLIAVLPMTSDALVDAFLERLGLDGDAWVRVTAAEQGAGADAAGSAPGLPAEPLSQARQVASDGTRQQTAIANGSPGSAASPSGPCVVARLRALVQGCLDIGAASPRRYFFQVLLHFVSSDLERERLSYFATAEGRDDLYRYNRRESRTLLEVLQDFRTAAPPLDRLLEAAPHLRPRLFSAASSQRLRGPMAAHLLVALVSYNTPLRRSRTGLCSAYLARLDPEAAAAAGEEVRVAVWTEKGSLRPPKTPETPLVLIGPGTGVAPFRSFLEDRYAQLLQHQGRLQKHGLGSNGEHANGTDHQAIAPSQPQGSTEAPPLPPSSYPSEASDQEPPAAPAPCHLFFGCRSSTADFYYRDQWEQYVRAGVLNTIQAGLVTAFSREAEGVGAAAAASSGDGDGGAAATAGGGAGGGSGSRKVYVTQRIREHGGLLWRLLSEGGAAVYVSGSAKKMPEGVAAAFADVLVEHGGMGREAAAAYVRQMELKGRYQVEAWS